MDMDEPNGVNPDDPTRASRAVAAAGRSSQVMGGILLVVLGLMFFADRQGWILGWPVSFARLWPLLLVALGISRLIVPSDVVVESSQAGQERVHVRHRLGGGVWLVVVGGLLLLHVNHVLRLDQSWPIFIVVGGLSLIFGERRARVRRFRGGRRGP